MATNRSILITAGSTWVAIDNTRVISNTATGETGLILAEKFRKTGAKVTLLFGPGNFYKSTPGVRIISFKYFSELKQILTRELKKRKYAAIIHAAAVADYRPKKIIQHKVCTRLSNWKINLVPTNKLIDCFKTYDPKLIVVGFKFEPDAWDNHLIKKGRQLLKRASLDLVVANSYKKGCYRAFILDNTGKSGPFSSKTTMANILSKLVINKL